MALHILINILALCGPKALKMHVLCLFPVCSKAYEAVEDPRNQRAVRSRPANLVLTLADGKNGRAYQFVDRAKCIDVNVPPETIEARQQWKFLISNIATSRADIILPPTPFMPNFTVAFHYSKSSQHPFEPTAAQERAALMMRVRSDAHSFHVRVTDVVKKGDKEVEEEHIVTSQNYHLRDVLYLDLGPFVFQVGHALAEDLDTPAVLRWKQLHIADDRIPIGIAYDEWRPTGRSLGKGSSGSVEVVVGMLSGALRATKHVVVKPHETEKGYRTLAERDVLRTLTATPHKNIVRYYGTLTEAEGATQIYRFFLQACHGDIEQLIASGVAIVHFPTILKHIGEAIEHLHNAMNIMHRDIKPNNLFFTIPYLDEEGFEGKDRDFALGDTRPDALHFFIGDFGHARSWRGHDFSTFLGTLNYLPPEVNKDPSQIYGKSADIFSLGITLMEVLDHPVRKLYDRHYRVPGWTPEQHLDDRTHLNAYVRELQDLPAPSKVQPFLWQYLKRMVAFDPTQRPSITEILATLGDVAVWSTVAGQDVLRYVDGKWCASPHLRVGSRSRA